MNFKEALDRMMGYGTFSPTYLLGRQWGLSFRDVVSAPDGRGCLEFFRPIITRLIHGWLNDEGIDSGPYLEELYAEVEKMLPRLPEFKREVHVNYVIFLGILIEALGGEPVEIPEVTELVTNKEERLIKERGRLENDIMSARRSWLVGTDKERLTRLTEALKQVDSELVELARKRSETQG